ncbi:TIGR02530 family flagellar biosynthesis protein [uncultured Desulfuromonas sp.]|uniref:TIGR02530 family flagellar biosynthesis protein n=1 Tax=uncultured Desulfuromonas sp. TaxID=181013 RepID=UPI002AABCEB8|nr:TIGR02530 family flagellar biosynthesis protein [uncultured Desulfuromonas sp.]
MATPAVRHAAKDIGTIRFSAHSRQRMLKRGVQFSAGQLARIEEALITLQHKGSRTSVVMVDGAALVVSVPQATVVTVVDQAGLRDQVFTNIDSAVFA